MRDDVVDHRRCPDAPLACALRAERVQLQVAPAIQKAWKGEAPLYHASWGSYSVNDVSAIFPVMFGKDANDNYSKDPELEKLVAEGGATSDLAVRKKAYSAAVKIMTEKAYWLPLFTYVNSYAFNKQLEFKTYPDELPPVPLARAGFKFYDDEPTTCKLRQLVPMMEELEESLEEAA